VKAPEQTIDYMDCKLSSLFLHVSAYSQQQLWIGCNLCRLRVNIAYLDIESKLANNRFVNILAFESAIQMLNGLATNMRNPAPAVKIIRVRCVCDAIIGCARVCSRVITWLAHCVRTISCVVAAHSVLPSLCEGCFLFFSNLSNFMCFVFKD